MYLGFTFLSILSPTILKVGGEVPSSSWLVWLEEVVGGGVQGSYRMTLPMTVPPRCLHAQQLHARPLEPPLPFPPNMTVKYQITTCLDPWIFKLGTKWSPNRINTLPLSNPQVFSQVSSIC